MTQMSPIDWAKRPLQKYAEFSGRAPRAEYWWFYLLTMIAFVIAIFIDGMIGSDFGGSGYGVVTALAGLALIVPSIAVGIRRLHDTDRTGWWLLIALVPLVGAIVLLVFYVTEGTKGDNQYGPDPYAGGA